MRLRSADKPKRKEASRSGKGKDCGAGINAGYVITDRLAVGEYEFVIGERQEAPASFVTWQCKKDSREYFWGHYCSDRKAAVEDFCKRVLDEVRYMKQFSQEKHPEETVPSSKKSDRNHER